MLCAIYGLASHHLYLYESYVSFGLPDGSCPFCALIRASQMCVSGQGLGLKGLFELSLPLPLSTSL